MNNSAIFLQTAQVSSLLKIGFLVMDFAFIIFLIVVIKQVHTMHTIVNDSNDASLIKSSAFLLFIVAVSLFLTALVIL